MRGEEQYVAQIQHTSVINLLYFQFIFQSDISHVGWGNIGG